LFDLNQLHPAVTHTVGGKMRRRRRLLANRPHILWLRVWSV